MPNSKPFWQSKSLWLTAAAAVVAVLTALLGTDLVRDNPAASMWIAAVVAALAAVLRVFTSTSLSSGDSTMKVWILFAVAASLLFAADANAFCCCRPRVTKTQVNNADGSVTTIKATVPVFFPLLRGPKLQVTTSQGR